MHEPLPELENAHEVGDLTTLPDSDLSVKQQNEEPEIPAEENQDVSAEDFAPAELAPVSESSPSAPEIGQQQLTRDPNVTYNKDGTPRKKRGPKPKGQVSAAVLSNQTEQAADSAVLYGTSLAFVHITTGALASLIGPEWAPEKGEAEELAGYGAQYMKSLGVSEPSPGIVLALCVLAYASKRTAHENTLSKVKGWGIRGYLWAKSLFWK